ncbi:MAG: AraC family transcriptional regulator [Flavobacterium sp. MedPE-SWcel]|uniref:GyrI-like domain-containing protein n=1 Tax=uncultured Flavobacterium sp. TaxID=165435 RepID=UPI000912DBDC|nr:GyrI-like domain-containing protein [uncultured Flavobacterium sp.]OIQ21026.1 MAG: AraC family transcriptional regulator [Flavobacterium sp. MedPE-SWcel]
MEKQHIDIIHLIGITLPYKTTNANNQAAQDCGQLWQEFEKGGWFTKIPEKVNNKVYAVYHNYDGDHTQPYSYFIGCKVTPETTVPEGMVKVIIQSGDFIEFTAKGKMPDCIGEEWNKIWTADIERAYKADFEIYDERCSDWNNAEIPIYIGI